MGRLEPFFDWYNKLGVTILNRSRKTLKKTSISFTLEECKKEALKFSDRTAFKVQSGSIYSYAYKLGWLNDICVHMSIKKKENGFWTKNQCLKEATKYKTRSEFSIGSSSAYSIAKRNNWLDEICSNMAAVGNKLNRAIYSFEFSNRYVYVGLSYKVEMRKYQHLNEKKSPVFKFLKETNEYFQHKFLTNYISKE